MLKRLFNFINTKFKSSLTIENKREDVMDLGETITVPKELIVEKKKRGRKKKIEFNGQMSEIID